MLVKTAQPMVGQEYIADRPDDSAPKAIMKKLELMSKIPTPELTQEVFDKIDLRKTILDKTGILIDFTLKPSFLFCKRYMIEWGDPMLTKNHVFYDRLTRWWELSDRGEDMMIVDSPIEGAVDGVNGRVSGDFTNTF